MHFPAWLLLAAYGAFGVLWIRLLPYWERGTLLSTCIGTLWLSALWFGGPLILVPVVIALR